MIDIYYVDNKNQNNILKTKYIDELILMLFDNTAKFISEKQIKILDLPKDYNNLLKNEISKYSDRIPMFDIKSNHIYLIYRDNVYPRLFYDNYRFVDKNFYDNILSIENPSVNEKEIIRILSYYDLEKLQKTYTKKFYESFVINNYVTSCQRPSYSSGMEHITPYYTLNELYYLAYDWNITDKKVYNKMILIIYVNKYHNTIYHPNIIKSSNVHL